MKNTLISILDVAIEAYKNAAKENYDYQKLREVNMQYGVCYFFSCKNQEFPKFLVSLGFMLMPDNETNVWFKTPNEMKSFQFGITNQCIIPRYYLLCEIKEKISSSTEDEILLMSKYLTE